MSLDSARETVGLIVMRVTWQLLRRRSKVANRRKGMRWPIPALGKRATWVVLGLWRSPKLDMVWRSLVR